MNNKLIKCPLCGGDVKYKKVDTTHTYSCNDCPFVAFEYYNKGNTIDMANYLDPDLKISIDHTNLHWSILPKRQTMLA